MARWLSGWRSPLERVAGSLNLSLEAFLSGVYTFSTSLWVFFSGATVSISRGCEVSFEGTDKNNLVLELFSEEDESNAQRKCDG